MELRNIPIDQLHISRQNMRHGRKKPPLDDLLPSIRERGVLQPLLVRPASAGEDGKAHFEIVAGRRRYLASKIVAEEMAAEREAVKVGSEGEPEKEAECGQVGPHPLAPADTVILDQPYVLPCAVMADGDDAAALEASLLENMARLPADEMTQYECFTRLIREGGTVDGIAHTFGITTLMVERCLALGNLVPGVRTLWREGDIDRQSLQHLTMATKARQKAWLKLFHDPEARTPLRHELKDWLLGGESIPVSVAIFDVDDYSGGIVGDLFGEERYFTDADCFWTRQMVAVEARKAELLADGWQSVEVMERGRYFTSWEYEACPKAKGGGVYLTISRRGEVEVHEGWITRAEARRREKAGRGEEGTGGSDAAARSETTGPLQDYLDLHRLMAARLSLIAAPETGFRLMVAHAVSSSGHWQVRPEPLRSRKASVTASIEASSAHAAFETERQHIRDLLGLPDGQGEVVRPGYRGLETVEIFIRLMDMDEASVMRIAAFVMAETLEAGSVTVEAAGKVLGTDTAAHWQADATFFDLIRDREVMQALLADIAGEDIADANRNEKMKTRKKIALDLAEGLNGRQKVEGWVPGWMRFPPDPVTEGGSYASSEQWNRISRLFER